MIFYIIYDSNSIDDAKFKIWLNHYRRTNVEFKIYVCDEDNDLFNNKYPYYSKFYVIDFIPDKKKVLELSVDDFLFSYTKNENDIMILNYNIDVNLIKTNLMNIGRIFSVPVINKNIYSTFEIPDFILYKHGNHTNYTIDGLIINNVTDLNVIDIPISDNIVCLNTKISKVAFDKEYYETNIISENWRDNINDTSFFTNVYDNFMMNTIVNKEKMYGFIWYPKCACSTLTHIFCELNGITLNNDVQKRRSLNFNILNKHHFNNYLQNIDFISFYRNPFHRVISTYIDKHVYKSDHIYVTLGGYIEYINKYKKDTLHNLVKYFLSGGYISEHFTEITKSTSFSYINNNPFNKCTTKLMNMKSGVNNNLYEFLNKYYDESVLESLNVLNCHENSMNQKNSNSENSSDLTIHSKLDMVYNIENITFKIDDSCDYEKFKDFDGKEWKIYLSENKLDYDYILKDEYLKENLYKLYEMDITQLQ